VLLNLDSPALSLSSRFPSFPLPPFLLLHIRLFQAPPLTIQQHFTSIRRCTPRYLLGIGQTRSFPSITVVKRKRLTPHATILYWALCGVYVRACTLIWRKYLEETQRRMKDSSLLPPSNLMLSEEYCTQKMANSMPTRICRWVSSSSIRSSHSLTFSSSSIRSSHSLTFSLYTFSFIDPLCLPLDLSLYPSSLSHAVDRLGPQLVHWKCV